MGTDATPVPAGGAIANGTYRLTKWQVYPPASPNTSTIKETIRITGSKMEVAVAVNDLAVSLNHMISSAGTTLMMTGSCAAAGVQLVPYTATATTLLIFSGDTSVETLTKQ